MATLEERLTQLEEDYSAYKDVMAQNLDAFFLVIVATIIYCEYFW